MNQTTENMSIEKSLYEQLEKQFVQANNERWQLEQEKTQLQLKNCQLELDLRILRDKFSELAATNRMLTVKNTLLENLQK